MNVNQLFKSLGGTPPFVGANKKDCPEPLSQWHMSSMKYRIGSYRGLMTTVSALKHFAIFHKIGFGMTAPGTLKSFRPSELFQIIKTALFGLKPFLKLKKTDFTVVTHVYLQYKVLTVILV